MTTGDNLDKTDSDSATEIEQYFDADVIYSSGTFETEEASIFEGLVDINEMSFTKDEETNSWSPAFWNATGLLEIGIEGLDISGDVTASYYRKGEKVPSSILSLPDKTPMMYLLIPTQFQTTLNQANSKTQYHSGHLQ